MFGWLVTIVDRLFAVIGALVFSQAPLFMHQYSQQLSGHVAELHLQVNMMQQTALLTGKTLDQFIQKFLLSTDPDFLNQGEIMRTMVVRCHNLSDALMQLQNSTFLTRPLTFLRHCDWDIVKSTAKIFQIGIPLNVEGFIYAFIGMIAGFFTFFILRRLFYLPVLLWRRLTAHHRAPEKERKAIER